MKNLLIILLLGAGFNCFSQKHYTAKDFFTENTIVWFGVDYSKAKFVGSFAQFKDAGTITGNTLRDKYFQGWNLVVLREPKKYDVAKFLKKENQINDIAPVEKINSEVDGDKIMQETDYTLPESELPGMVAKYKSTDKNEGLGVVFITESYNHSREKGSYYVVIFDIASKKILISEKFTVEPGGIGIKNYWASTILKTLQEVSGNYSKWKKSYGG